MAPFRSGRTVMVGPVTDRWGTWISVLVPVQDPQTRETLAVFGIDYTASEWYTGIWQQMVPDLVALSLLLLFAALIRIWYLTAIRKHLRTYLNEHDFLTGLYNRRFFEEEKARLNHRESWPVSVAICDINGLKLINDAFGHAEGDRLISNMARLVLSCCRSGYIVGRTGGDEFTVLMPRTDNERARHLVTQIQRAIETYSGSERQYEVSLSVGYSTNKAVEQGIDEAVKVAEHASTTGNC